MERRQALATLGTAAVGCIAGCARALPFGDDSPDAASVVEEYHYEGTELVVRLDDEFDIEQASIYDSSRDTQYASVERPSSDCRFQVVFPDRLETYATKSLYLDVKTGSGTVTEWIWKGPSHGHASAISAGPEGQARFEITNLGETPLLIRFVAISGDVPSPTVDPTGRIVRPLGARGRTGGSGYGAEPPAVSKPDGSGRPARGDGTVRDDVHAVCGSRGQYYRLEADRPDRRDHDRTGVGREREIRLHIQSRRLLSESPRPSTADDCRGTEPGPLVHRLR